MSQKNWDPNIKIKRYINQIMKSNLLFYPQNNQKCEYERSEWELQEVVMKIVGKTTSEKQRHWSKDYMSKINCLLYFFVAVWIMTVFCAGLNSVMWHCTTSKQLAESVVVRVEGWVSLGLWHGKPLFSSFLLPTLCQKQYFSVIYYC